MKNFLIIISGCAFYLFAFAACKKNNDEDAAKKASGAGVCSLVAVSAKGSSGFQDSIKLTYDSIGRIVRYGRWGHIGPSWPGGMQAEGVKKFVYDGNKIYVLDSPASHTYDTLFVDANLRILEHHTTTDPNNACSSVSRDVTQYVYDGSGNILSDSFINYQDDVPASHYSSVYTVSNGDILSRISMSGPNVTKYIYGQLTPPNFLSRDDIKNYGSAYTFRNKHLLQGQEPVSNYNSTLNYGFDGNGNLVSVVNNILSDTTHFSFSYNYYYDCH